MNNTHNVLIEDIEQAKNKKLEYEFDDIIEDIPTNGNIQAKLLLESLGEFIKITGNVKLTAKLECDICLNEYEEIMEFQIDEMLAKGTLLEEYGQEFELKDGQFVTDLNGEKEIDIKDLLYQSVIINLPDKKVCGIKCKEGFFETEETYKIPDTRMEVFKNIKVDRK
ncbi:DUF177 domain-containing protein [bacterium]|nr:DUF177 domain-containing protein [bacterium]